MRIRLVIKALAVGAAVWMTAARANASVMGTLDLQGTETVADPSSGNPYDVNVYNFVITDDTGNATSVGATFTGNLIQGPSGNNATFRDTAAFATVFGHTLADSFFVYPSGDTVLPAVSTDTSSRLSATFTTSGAHTIIPGDGTPTTLAVLATPTDVAAPTFQTGQVVINNQIVPITTTTPEPASLALLAIGGVLLTVRRRQATAGT